MGIFSNVLEKVKKKFKSKKAGDSVETCPLKETGLLVNVIRADDRQYVEGAKVELSGPVSQHKQTDSDGIALFKPTEPGTYNIDTTLPTSMDDTHQPVLRQTNTVSLGSTTIHMVKAVPFATIKVKVLARENDVNEILDDVSIQVGERAAQKTVKNDWLTVNKLPIGNYKITISDLGRHASDYVVPDSQNVYITAGKEKEVLFYVRRASLEVKVVNKHKTTQLIPGVKVTAEILGQNKKLPDQTTDQMEPVKHESVKTGKYRITISFRDEDKTKYRLPEGQRPYKEVDIRSSDDCKVEFQVELILQIHMKLQFKDPEKNPRIFPEELPVRFAFNAGSPVDAFVGKDGVVYDKKGDGAKPYVEIVRKADREWFTLSFNEQVKREFIVCENDGENAKTQLYLLEEDMDSQANRLARQMNKGRRVFMLPKRKWNLSVSEWTVDGAITYNKDTFQFEKLSKLTTTVGSEGSPATVTLDPRWQFNRFVFYDRKYGKSHHGDKPVGIPGILLKGVNKCENGNAASFDTASNWTLNVTDKEKGVQCLPWIISKDDAKKELKLDNKMMLEFGYKHTYIHSKSETDREFKVMDPAVEDNKKALKPGKDRNIYYDLPKKWKSKNYYTRLPDKGKFFDELTEDDIKGSFDSGKPLKFSLDDIVLVDKNGAQLKYDAMDKNKKDEDQALSKHSRVSLLYQDPDDKFKVTIYDPMADEPCHSKTIFQKDSSDVYRNVILTGETQADKKDLITRVIVFCSGFYDLFDKRAEAADFSKKQVLGARAAKLEDSDVSKKVVFSSDNDVAKAYVFSKRVFDMYYLHYGGEKDSTVYSSLVTYWSARFFYEDDAGKVAALGLPAGYTRDMFFKKDSTGTRHPGSLTDKQNYIKHGMKNAMERWNKKDYQFDENDGKTDVVIKSSTLFEAKEVEDPAGTFVDRGGSHKCLVVIVTNDLGSWASDSVMRMRNTAYQGEGEYWGSAANTEARENDYDGTTAPARCAFAHELGHAAIGLYDEYVYYLEGYSGILPRYEQYYPGMPYVPDNPTIMKSNQAIRMHQFWGRANWLNDESRIGRPLNKFLDGKQFKITYSPAGKAKLEYELRDSSDADYHNSARSKYRDIYKPAYSGMSHALGGNGKCDLLLYKLGDDEFARGLNGGTYDGILVLSPRISVRFIAGALGAWQAGKNYKTKDVVTQGGAKYICKQNHTSSPDFNTDKAANWIEISDKGDWSEDTAYAVQDMVKDGSAYYYCKSAHTSSGFATDAGKWHVVPDKGGWTTGTAYVPWDRAVQGGKTFICKANHNAGAFDADNASDKWLEVTEKGNWKPGTAYDRSNLADHGGSKYFCTGSHTSADRSKDDDKWLKVDMRTSSWKDAEQKDWASNLGKTIYSMLSGANGKFKLESDADHDFKKTYINVFPQYELVSSGNAGSAGTHFELEVKKDNTQDFDIAAPAKPKAGNDFNQKKLVRFLFGAAHNVDTNLAKEDLTVLKTWIETNAGGSFTVKDI